MTKTHLADVEEYRESGPAIKTLYRTGLGEARVVHLKPGQEVPAHPHDRFEVTLLPQKGHALLTLAGGEQIGLVPGAVYHDPDGSAFGIQNHGAGNFQMTVLLTRKHLSE